MPMKLKEIAVVVAIVALGASQTIDIEKCSSLEHRISTLERQPKVEQKTVTTENKTTSSTIETAEVECTLDGYIDTFTITAYCPCMKCCGNTKGITATGTVATEGRTIGVDPNVIPFGSEVIIDGHSYIAEDTGSIKGKKIDLFMCNHERALQFGRQTKAVTVKGI